MAAVDSLPINKAFEVNSDTYMKIFVSILGIFPSWAMINCFSSILLADAHAKILMEVPSK